MSRSVIRKGIFFLMTILFLIAAVRPALAGEATLNWQAPATNTNGTAITGLSGYKLYYGTASGNYTASVNVGNVTAYNLAGLLDGVKYYFAVTAYNTSGAESAYSSEVSKTTVVPDTAGPVISGLYAVNITSDTAIITWVTDEPSDSQVQYGTTASYGYSVPVDATLTTAHSQTLTGLVPSTLYNFSVLSMDAQGNRTISANATFTTDAPVDSTSPVLSNIQAGNITSGSAAITWTTDEPSTSQVKYGSTWTAENTELVSVHTVDLTGLSGFTPYEFAVKSVDAAGNSAVSGTHTFTTSNTQPSITAFGATPLSGTTPQLVNFTATAADVDGYIVSYEWDFEGDGQYDLNSGSTPSASFTYGTVGTYSARLKITDNGGAVTVSDPLTISVSSATNQPPVIVQILGTITQSGSSLTIKFDVSASDPNGVIVKFAWDFDGNGTIDAETTTAPAQYTYPAAGTYTPTVTVTDNQGGVATGQSTVTVEASAAESSGSTQTTSSSGDSGGSSGGGCFIATAAYGSYLEPEVMVLREFRDKYLLTNRLGAGFVRMYYDLSPVVADYISRHQWAKYSVRALLTPVVYGLKHPGIALFMFIVSAAIAIRFVFKHRM